MHIGEPRRTIIVEPVEDPVPRKTPAPEQPVERPDQAPSEPGEPWLSASAAGAPRMPTHGRSSYPCL